MASSGNPAKRAKQEQEKLNRPMKVTSLSDWKSPKESSILTELPSGNVVRIRRPDIAELVAADLLPDSLTPKAQAAIDKAKGKDGASDKDSKLKAEDLELKPKDIAEVLDSFARICELVVVEPLVKFHKVKRPDGTWETISEAYRDEDTLYSDCIELEDQTFIFNFAVGGTQEIDQFRREFGEAVGGISSSEGLEMSSE